MDLAGARARFGRSLAGEVAQELVRVEVIDRSLALASKLFVAVIPLSIIVKAIAPGPSNFGEDLVQRLGLTGVGASATRTLFATGGEVRAAVSVIGLVIVLYSVLSFTAYTVVLSPVRDLEHHHNVGSLYAPSAILFGAAFWLWTPHMLLGTRISWHRLLPTALLTTVGVTLFSAGTAIFLPEIISSNAERYGLIGVAFGLVTWLFAYAAVVVVSAVIGGTWDRRRQRARDGHAGAAEAEPPRA